MALSGGKLERTKTARYTGQKCRSGQTALIESNTTQVHFNSVVVAYV